MAVLVGADREPVLAVEAESGAIRELEAALSRTVPDMAAARLVAPNGESLPLPVSVHTLLRRMVHDLAAGHAVSIIPVEAELSTQQAADLLSVSRPFLIKVLEAGEMAFHSAGTHRRIYLQDLLEYKRRRSKERRRYIREAAQEAQELGLYE